MYLDEVTAPGGTGTQATTDPGFEPDAVIGWAANNSADGASAAGVDSRYSIGFATERGGSIQQVYTSFFNDDAVGTSVTCRGLNTTAFLKGLTAPTTTTVGTDYEVDMSSFDASGYTLNWADLPTTGSMKLNCLCLGGANITDALAFMFTTTASVGTQDVDISAQTGGTGWTGKPDLLFFIMQSAGHTAGDAADDSWIGFGVGGQNFTNGRSTNWGWADNAGTMDPVLRQTAKVWNRFNASPIFSWDATLSATGSWPANGFQLTYTGTSTAEVVGVLALQGTFTYTLGTHSPPRAGAPPVTVDFNHGSTPELGLTWGGGMPSSAATQNVDASGCLYGAFWMGATDGTRELGAGATDDSANSTSQVGAQWSNTKTARVYEPASGAATLVAEADGSFSGNNFRLSWNDIDAGPSADREYNALTIGNTGSTGAATTSLPFLPPNQVSSLYSR